MKMPIYLDDACDLVDACFFTGDTFFDEEVMKEMEFYLNRWNKKIIELKEIQEEIKLNDVEK